MDLIKITLTALTAAMLALFIKQYRPEYAMLISIAAGIIIFLGALPHLAGIFDLAGEFAVKTGLDSAYLAPIIKIVGITYVTGYSCEMCRDAGEGALAAKLEMAGKIMALALALPVVSALFNTIMKIIP